MTSALRATVLSIMAATLGACGHGGGGGGGSGTPTQIPPAPAPNQTPAPGQTPPPDQTNNTPPDNTPRTDAAFSSFSAVKPSQNVIMSGSATTVSGTQLTNGTVMSVNQEANTAALSPSTLTLGFDKNRALTALAITAPEGNVSFDRSAGHTVSCGGGTCSASSATASAVTGDAFANGWNYQTYGAWAVHSNPTSFVFGAVSAGNATPGNAVPTTGSATFTGRASGIYIDPAGTVFNTDAGMTANVAFGSRGMSLGTQNTTLTNTTTGARRVDNGLNFGASLSWDAGSSKFSGAGRTANNNFEGSPISGSFYGPNAEEIGGTYHFVSGPTSRLVGGFGGKR